LVKSKSEKIEKGQVSFALSTNRHGLFIGVWENYVNGYVLDGTMG